MVELCDSCSDETGISCIFSNGLVPFYERLAKLLVVQVLFSRTLVDDIGIYIKITWNSLTRPERYDSQNCDLSCTNRSMNSVTSF